MKVSLSGTFWSALPSLVEIKSTRLRLVVVCIPDGHWNWQSEVDSASQLAPTRRPCLASIVTQVEERPNTDDIASEVILKREKRLIRTFVCKHPLCSTEFFRHLPLEGAWTHFYKSVSVTTTTPRRRRRRIFKLLDRDPRGEYTQLYRNGFLTMLDISTKWVSI